MRNEQTVGVGEWTLTFNLDQTLSCLLQKWPLYCPQGSGTLRQQLLIMRGIAWYYKVLHCIA